ncbi:hypothetical protein BDV98DRAFT_587968 [Pterulicium gracile]|uniref:RlpA-like protein double-psi beta-barrel domain-containing protein n=1 Tax=Pterulicium gracile TaxID=1884261 RepID=A0A5C3R3X9_9AGAR|nr:hypothetical protein BDV98DRAFT_587968 [Pterula gracilis]
MRATLFLVALSSSLAVSAAPLAARATPPKGWIQSILEPYTEYNARYMRVGCHKQHHTQFFKDCCSPMKTGETLEKNRKPECVVTYVAPASSAPAPAQAKPTTAPVVDAATGTDAEIDDGEDYSAEEDDEEDLEECDDEEDVVEEDDDEECPADTGDDEEADDEEDCEEEEEAEPTALPTQPASTPKPSSAPEPSASAPKPSSTAPARTSSAAPPPAPTSAEEPTTSSKPPATTTPESSSTPKPTEAPSSGDDGEENFSGGQATFYDQNGNAGACGNFRKDSDLIVAMDYRFYGALNKKSEFCGRKVVITNTDNGKTVTATVEDACPTCKNKTSLDLSRAAFNAIGAEEKGVLPIKWHFA